MVTKECTVLNETGIHVRPATVLAKTVTPLSANVTIESKGKTANAKSLIEIISLRVSIGDVVKVTVDGENEEAICNELVDFIANIRD